MGWFQTAEGPVYATGGLADVYRQRGLAETDDHAGVQPKPRVRRKPTRKGDAAWEPTARPKVTTRHRANAKLTKGEQAAADKTIADES